MLESSGLLKIEKNLVKPASICCARAFEESPYFVYLIPDKRKRAYLHYSFACYLNMSTKGTAESYVTSPRCEGVAMWVPPGSGISFWSFLSSGNPLLPLKCGWRFIRGEFLAARCCHQIKRKYAPERHLYLGLLAVDPSFQGKGFASALLKPVLKKADELHLPCYLETETRKNEAMYHHFGFNTVFETCYPGTTIPLIAMLRKPQ
ncbi:MAG: GNAT family N-acetyltransferase [Dehalococcoidales bacterium]|nr:GNAT family N-acetyltransferase [Dehalococcoidales bacterium]